MTKVNDIVSAITRVVNVDNATTLDNQNVSDFSNSIHNHDARYYRESEVVTLLENTYTTPATASWRTLSGLMVYTSATYGRMYVNHVNVAY